MQETDTWILEITCQDRHLSMSLYEKERIFPLKAISTIPIDFSKIEHLNNEMIAISLGELLLDYEDYLRQRGMKQWTKDHPKALKVRSARPETVNWTLFGDRTDEELANILICLINQASYLLWRQIERLEKDFLKEGGFTERMNHARKKARGR